ncbi:MAG: 50S ribosomal protein L22 [Acidobacteriota bacterium]|nr:MAG: 50S ribosomal protein L22 [Acidobacteriota bacterium]
MEAVAKTRYLKGSPRKARLVIDLVRGKNVSHALAILKFTNKRAADPIAKCLRSAIANATYKAEQENIAIDPDDLWIKTCFVDMGPTKNRRRLRPAPQGRAFFERRHYCHITIEVTSEPQEEKEEPVRKETKAKKAPAKKTEAKAEKPSAKKAKDEKAEEAKAEAPAEAKKEPKPAAKTKKEAPKAEKEAPKADKAEAKKEEAEPARKEAKPEEKPAKKAGVKDSKDAENASSEEE